MFKKLAVVSSISLVLATGFALMPAQAELEFRGTISGDVLDTSGEEDTPQVLEFRNTGQNPYNGDFEAMKKGYVIFSTACSGCHGHLAEGKLGPALNDDYWTYPTNLEDKGLFETIFGGAAGMMGPQQGLLTQDEILQVMAWIRALEKDPKKAQEAVDAFEKKNS
ncbi:cytochrome c(L), periplasmic [Methylobacillus sp.]|uniref:cytochrome c(L), periplasmic n=1 Tax=Methylobacillus sp. TaxID=56818 RepID=UPI0012CEF348|nr:cytochrome c(L), periplasmic [Methylobacillus sp.]MPS48342.1 cytochrome c(L), periplasmic [Methylobacillus sp.]